MREARSKSRAIPTTQRGHGQDPRDDSDDAMRCDAMMRCGRFTFPLQLSDKARIWPTLSKVGA